MRNPSKMPKHASWGQGTTTVLKKILFRFIALKFFQWLKFGFPTKLLGIFSFSTITIRYIHTYCVALKLNLNLFYVVFDYFMFSVK